MPHIGTFLEAYGKKEIKRVMNLSRCLMCTEGGDLDIGEAELAEDGKSLEMWCTCPVCASVYLYKFKLDGIERHSNA